MAVLINGLRPSRARARVLPGRPGRGDRGGDPRRRPRPGDRPPRRSDGRAHGARRRGAWPRSASTRGRGSRAALTAVRPRLQAGQRHRADRPGRHRPRRGRPRRAGRRRRHAGDGAAGRGPPGESGAPANERELPAPLAEPRLDFRVDRGHRDSPTRCKQGEYIQVIDVQGRQCSDFLAFHRAKLEKGVERGLDATVTRTLMGQAYPTPGPARQVLRPRHGARSSRSSATRSAATTRSRSRARPSTTRTSAIPATSTAPTTSTARSTRYEIAPRKGWEALNFFYNTAFDSQHAAGVRRALVAARGLRDAARDDRPGVRVIGLPRRRRPFKCLGGDRCPRTRLFPAESVLRGHRPPRDRRRPAGADAGDRVPPAHVGPHQIIPRVPRLLAAALLQQRGRDRRVLGVPREGRRDGPLPAAQMGGARSRCRDPDPANHHARRAQAVGRARSSTRRSATRPAA